MSQLNIVLNSSLPRSGSTLLQNLLAQHPEFYCSPTSDLLELIVQLRNSYGNFDGFKSQGLLKIAPRIRDAMRGIVTGFYASEITAGRVIFEKCRGHSQYLELWEEVLGERARVVCCVRDIREVVASFERLYRTSQLTKSDVGGEAYFDCQTTEGRARQLLSSGAVLGLSLARLHDVFTRRMDDRLIIVPYDHLVSDPAGVLMILCVQLGLTPFVVDSQNVIQHTHEDDGVHGMRLHDVRPVVSKEGSTVWTDFLPIGLGQELNERYQWLQELAGVKDEPADGVNVTVFRANELQEKV